MKVVHFLKNINCIKVFQLERLGKTLIYLLSVVVFVGANLVFSLIPLKFDFSYGKAYSLSSSTKKIIKNLDDVLNIKFFVSSDLPTRLLPLKTEVLDFLNEYKKESRGKIVIKVLDPKKDNESLKQAQESGLSPLQFSQLEQNKYQLTTVYFGLVLSYGTKKELIPQATDLESLEYNLTSLIYKMTKKELEKVAVLGKKEEFDQQNDDLLSFKKVLRQQFILDFIDVSSSSATKEIDKSYKTVVVFDDNRKEYDEQEIAALKNYLKQGGKVVFLVDGVWVLDSLQTTEAKHNLFSLISDFGIELKKDLVLSTLAELVNFGNQLFQFIVPYPFWVKTNIFSKNQTFFSNINALLYPWVSSIELKNQKGIKTEALVYSTKKSWIQKDNFVLDPQNIPNPQASDLKERIITAYAKTKNNGEMVLIPSSRFVLEKYLSRMADNLEFVLNIVNNLAAKGALSGIRQRAVIFYPLPSLEENQKDLFRFLNIFLLPSFFAIFGFFRLWQRGKD